VAASRGPTSGRNTRTAHSLRSWSTFAGRHRSSGNSRCSGRPPPPKRNRHTLFRKDSQGCRQGWRVHGHIPVRPGYHHLCGSSSPCGTPPETDAARLHFPHLRPLHGGQGWLRFLLAATARSGRGAQASHPGLAVHTGAVDADRVFVVSRPCRETSFQDVTDEVSHAWCEMTEALVLPTRNPHPQPLSRCAGEGRRRRERGAKPGVTATTLAHAARDTSPSPGARERGWGEGSPALAPTMKVFRIRRSRRVRDTRGFPADQRLCMPL
jgi:hypothetical protein